MKEQKTKTRRKQKEMIEWYKVPKPDKYFNFPLPDLATRL